MRSRQAGVTLIEMMVAVGILALLVTIALSLLMVANTNFTTEVVVVDLEQHWRWVLERIVEDARGAGTCTVTGTGNDLQVEFQPNEGYDDLNQTILLGNAIRYFTQLFPGEIDDGIDNNANGLIDERQLMRLDTSGTVNSVISPWIEEGGFQAVDLVQSVQITVSLRNIDASGVTHRRQVSQTVQFRNP